MSVTLSVRLNGITVGYLTQNERDETTFRFSQSYLSMEDRPVLSQSFEDNLMKTYAGKKGALPAFFENLIPEPGPLRDLIEKTLKTTKGDSLSLLEAVGRDLPGALEVTRVEEASLSVRQDLETAADLEAIDSFPQTAVPGLRFSLAGVQLKFSVLRDAQRITLPAHNQHGDWIVKLSSSRFPFVVENEYAIMQWAIAAGFDVPECYLQDTETVDIQIRDYTDPGDKVFVIRRYDRTTERRVHQEDFAQVTGLRPQLKYDHVKYEQIGGLVKNLLGNEAYYEFIRRLTFVIASGNADAHLKNWSLLYLNNQQPSLAPMYDQVCTVAWPEVKSELALKLAGTKNWFSLDLKRFELLAERAGMDPKRTVQTVQETLATLVQVGNRSDVLSLLPSEHLQRLQVFWTRVPILKPFASEMQWS